VSVTDQDNISSEAIKENVRSKKGKKNVLLLLKSGQQCIKETNKKLSEFMKL
jgi:hypothetical protein